MRSTSLRQARSWTVAVLAASAVATAITGFHLAADHAAAIAAGTGSSSGPSNVQPAQHPDDNGFTLFDDQDGGDDGSGGLFGSGSQTTPGFQDNQGTQSQNGFGSPGQLGTGSGPPQVTSHGS